MNTVTQAAVDETIRDIVEKLQAGYAPQKVILFGSHAYGNPGCDSDIDLLVIKETSERFIDRWVTVRRLLSDPTRMLPVEVIVLTPQELTQRLDIGDQFLREIIDRGEVLYAA
jgi:predicted nucleotidyltransferase